MHKQIVYFIVFLVVHYTQNVHAQNKSAEPKGRAAETGKHLVGDNYGGGKVFWLDASGMHGLVAAPADQSAKGVAWSAKLCLDFTITVSNVAYDDWYLPSKPELNLMYQQKNVIGGFNLTSGIYWSSTESSETPGTMAWEQEFKFGSSYEDDKDLPNQVRCIRKF